MMIRGSVDEVSSSTAAGWLFAAGRQPLTVQAWLDGQIIGETIADRHRPDLAAAGLGDGNCGFAINFVREISPPYVPAIVVCPAECNVEVPRTVRTDPAALLAAIRDRYPAAGQHASLYGGLWTDRTDAKALLAGRIAVGITPAEVAAPLTQFVLDGLVLLPTEPGLAALRNGTFTPLVTAALTSPRVLPLLRHVLEDNPLVLAVELLDHADGAIYQPSTLRDMPSPAECLEILVPLTPGLSLSVVRDGHRLPEYVTGRSRWTEPLDRAIADRALAGHAVDEYDIPEATIAVIGPGTLHSIKLEPDAQYLRALVSPRRIDAPNSTDRPTRRQRVHASGLVVAT